MQETLETGVWFLGWEDPLAEGIATLSSVLAWKIPWTEKPGGLQFIGSQRVGYNWSNLAHTHVRYVSWPFTPKYFTIIFLRVRRILLYNHITVTNSVNLARIQYFNLWFVFKFCWLINSIILLPILQKLVYRQVLHLIVMCGYSPPVLCSLAFHDLDTFSKSSDQVICRLSLDLGLFSVFLWLVWGYRL